MKLYVCKRTRTRIGRAAAAVILCLAPILGGWGTAACPAPEQPPVTDEERFGVIHVIGG